MSSTVLVIDGDPSSHRAIARWSRANEYNVQSFLNRADFLKWVDGAGAAVRHQACRCCVVFDAEFVDLFQLEAVSHLLRKCPRICVSRSSRVSTTLSTIRLGLFDFVEKPFQVARMIEVVRQALAYCEAQDSRTIDIESLRDKVAKMTKREIEICELLSRGHTGKAIAHALGISVKTFYVHRSNVIRKTGLKSVLQLAKCVDLLPQRRIGLALLPEHTSSAKTTHP